MAKQADLTKRSLEELVKHCGEPGSQMSEWTKYEFLRRQTKLQAGAAKATKQTAEYAQRSAAYMLFALVVLALASIAQVLVTWLTIGCRYS